MVIKILRVDNYNIKQSKVKKATKKKFLYK